jgi:IS30 family transposase
MKYHRRIYYSTEQRAEIWERWQRGESMRSIGRVFDRQSSSVFSVISPTGGIRPPDRRRRRSALSLSEGEEISRGLSTKQSLRAIARQLRRASSTISREVRRNGGLAGYRATASDHSAWDRALRLKMCKLASTRHWPAQYPQSCGASGLPSRLRVGSNVHSQERRTNRCHTKRSIAAFIYRHVAFLKRSCWRLIARSFRHPTARTIHSSCDKYNQDQRNDQACRRRRTSGLFHYNNRCHFHDWFCDVTSKGSRRSASKGSSKCKSFDIISPS